MNQSPPHILAANTKRLRLALGWSQVELARCSGIPQRTISAIERADHKTSVAHLEGLGKAFGCPLWALLFADLELSLFTGNSLDKLIEHYVTLPEISRQEINRVVEREQRYFVCFNASHAIPFSHSE